MGEPGRKYSAPESIDDSLLDHELLNAADDEIQHQPSVRSRRPSEKYQTGRSISELGHYSSGH